MKHVYIVDDEVAILEALQAVMDDEGYEVTIAPTPHLLEALSRNEAPVPDLILLDVFLGERDGIEIAHSLKQNPLTAAIPIILMSAQPKQVSEEASSIADLFLAKPFDVDVLLEAIDTLTLAAVGA